MTDTRTAEALEIAFRIEDGDESASRVKAIVADTLAETDRHVVIVQTRCFNHSYVPDMVLEWPRRGARVSREVYLRPSNSPSRLKTDVEQNVSASPMFLHLSTLGRNSRSEDDKRGFDELAVAARNSRSLVTEVGALAELSNGESPATQILPPTILRGGVGLLDEDGAKETARIVDIGFAGALEARRAETAEALAIIDAVLDTSSANELSTFIETMWIASGGDPMEFPGVSHDLGAQMPARRLQALLEAVSDDSDAFWGRIGTSIDIDSLAGLSIVSSSRALQTLINSAVAGGKLVAHACRLNPVPTAADSAFHWQVDDGVLSLNGNGIRASVGLRKEDLPKPELIDETLLPSPADLAARARLGEINLRQVEFTGSGRALSLRSVISDDNIPHEELAETYSNALGVDPRTVGATALIGSKYLDLDFSQTTAAGRTVAKFTASSLLWASIIMLTDFPAGEAESLRSLLWSTTNDGASRDALPQRDGTDSGSDSGG